ncbi:MAG: hypothetical protein IPK88_00715 [Saprospiraceae bacterium]|nr:hypothetical protein [Candidatus Defluviibacterium haderslevense]
MKQFKYTILIFFALCSMLRAQITGIVFRDYNANGLRDSTAEYFEPGEKNVEVRLTDRTGAILLTTSNAKGYFTLNPSISQPYRIEFNYSKVFDYDGAVNTVGVGSKSSVQFIYQNKEFVSFGVNYPQDYTKNPELFAPCYVIGNPQDPTAINKDFDAFVNWDYNNGGQNYNNIVPLAQGGTANNLTKLATGKQIGACWGVAHQKNTDIVFTTAILKRHAGIGPKGYGGLYLIQGKKDSIIFSMDLNTIGIPSGSFLSNTARHLPTSFPLLSADSLAFSHIGKIGYGGIDISEDGKTLYLISLYTKKLYSIFINNPFEQPDINDVDSFAIPDPNCNRGTYRPWAVKMHRGKLYVGVVCDGSGLNATTADLNANVYEFDPAVKTFSNVLSFSLDYKSYGIKASFLPWVDTWDPLWQQSNFGYCDHAQAILSDIEFDGDDHMVVGIMDRLGMQGGFNQENTSGHPAYSVISLGDVLRSTYNSVTHKYEIEQNASDGVIQTDGRNTGFGPDGGEYYHGDNALDINGATLEAESANGALAYSPGYGNMITSAMAPYGFFSNGVLHLDNKNGNWNKRFQIIPPDFTLFLGKSNGLGDLKVRSKPAPIEIGNYVWKDLNRNGIQDPIEPPLANISIQLLKNNTVIASAITNKNGNYIFSNDNNPSQNDYPNAFIYGIKDLNESDTFSIRIPNYVSQMSNGAYLVKMAVSPYLHLPKIDNNGTIIIGNDIVSTFQTNLNGSNDHSFDFGFYSLIDGHFENPVLNVGSCDAITNSFNLSLSINAVNGPIGDIIVELSTGEKRRFAAVPDGPIQVVLNNIETKGTQNVNIKIYYVNDPSVLLQINDAFNQPAPCCMNDFSICGNRESQVEFNAVPNLVYYAWYDSTTHTLQGNLQKLILDKTSLGLQDSYEAYYFIGVNVNGDTIRQYCYFKLKVIDCCALSVNQFFQTECNNNGTLYNTQDDYFAVLINASNPEAGLSNNYEVVVNNKIIGTQPYGTPILVGEGGPNADFKSDGVSKYKIIIRDVDNKNCLDSLFTTPTTCPIPRLTVKKVLQSNAIQSDASYNIVYRIEVKNEGTEVGTYNLIDDPGFDDDVKIGAAFFTTNIPNKGGNALTGSGPWTLVTNQSIGPGVSHVILFTINISLDFSSESSGNNVYTKCGSANSNFSTKGEGLFNRALLDFDANGSIDVIDTSCTDIPFITLEKIFLGNTQKGVKLHNIKYQLIVRNTGGADGNYNLLDKPGFDDDITITNASYQSNVGLNGILSNAVPLNGWIIASNRTIMAGKKDTFVLSIDVELDLETQSLGNNTYRPCGFVNPSISRSGEGLFNVGFIDLNNDFRSERRDTVCSDLPYLTHEKTLLSQNYLIDDRVETNYLIRVINKGGLPGTYHLKDKPSFDDDLEIEHAEFRINNGLNLLLNNNPGPNGWTLASNKILNPFSVDSIFVTLVSHIDLNPGSSGDQVYHVCKKNALGEYEAGNGLFNESLMDINNDGIDDQRDTVCSDYEIYDLALRKTCLSNVPVLTGDKLGFRVTVFNQGNQMARHIEIVDYLPKAYVYDTILSTNWSKRNDSTFVFVIDSLLPQDSMSIDFIVRVNKYLSIREFAINSAEIASFLGNQGQQVKDYDSTPDDNRRNDNVVKPYELFDDYLLGRRKFIPDDDEDDHDVAIALFFDLALTKKVVTKPPYFYNDHITFSIKVFNQGSVAAKRFNIVDYIPSGLEFDPLDNLLWTSSSGKAFYDFQGSLNPGDSVELFIVLKLLPNKKVKDWVNVAEVASASIFTVHNVNISIIDFDSDGDTILINDAGGIVNSITDDHTLDNGHDLNMDGITDEDDHDPAVVYVWDLALKKILNTPPPHLPNQTLEFVIRVFNQGTDTVGSVNIVDYIPAGLEFNMVNSNWVLNGNQVNGTFNARILPGDSAQYQLYLRLKPGNRPLQEWINYAEIAGSKNSLNQIRTGFDIDSRELSDSQAERNVKPGNPQDNDIYSIDRGGEEDDHDPAKPVILDLALKKVRANQNIVRYGDTIDFNITIYNQGFIAVSQVSIIDYLPDGLNWINQNNWTYNAINKTAQYIWSGKLLPSDSVIIPIKLVVNTQFGANLDLVNYSEIFHAVDTANRSHTRDIDSFFDILKINDVGGNVNSNSDNAVSDDGFDSDNDGIADEDDSDPAIVELVDFALRKEIVNAEKGNAGDTTRFKITVFNQGNVTSGELSIKDYLNKAYQFLPAINTNWTISNKDVVYTFKKTLLPGQRDSVYLDLLVLQDSSVVNSYNWSEIISVKDINLIPIGDQDADSKPASDAPHERAVVPGNPDDDRINGGGLVFKQDEDDHDVAGIDTKATIGDMVWHDKNANGTMDQGEEGIEGIHVELYNAANNTLVRSTQTNKQGKYLFDGVKPAKYYIKFIIPTPWTITTANVDSDTLDSDVTHINGNGTTEMTMLMGGEDDRTWDLGLYKCVPIFGYVFLDLNRNGIYDFNENGINGLTLYIHDATTGAVVQSTRSYSNATRFIHDGYYTMCLKPGKYYLRVQSLSGFFSSPYHQGNDPIYDSDLQDMFGLYTTGVLQGASCDTIKDIGAGIYHNFVTTTILKERNDQIFELNNQANNAIKLSGFRKQNINYLNWESDQSLCLKFVKIYRKLEQEQQFKLIKVLAVDQLTTADYLCEQSFEDESVPVGSAIYTVQAFDEQFENIQSNQLILQDGYQTSNDLIISPNPAQDKIFVRLGIGKEPLIAYQIIDGFGKLIRSEEFNHGLKNQHPIQIDIHNLTSGNYFFKGISKNKIYTSGFQVQ